MKGLDQNTDAPMTCGVPSGGLSRPIMPPIFLATKNQKSTATSVQSAADQKKGRGAGKKETNMGLVFPGVTGYPAIDSREVAGNGETTHIFGIEI